MERRPRSQGLWRSACLHQPWPQLIDCLWMAEVSHISCPVQAPYFIGVLPWYWPRDLQSTRTSALRSLEPARKLKKRSHELSEALAPWVCEAGARLARGARGGGRGQSHRLCWKICQCPRNGQKRWFTLSVDGQMCRCGVDRQGRRCCALDNSKQGRAGCAPLLLDRAWPP